MSRRLIAIVCALALAGCAPPHRLDAHSYAQLTASLDIAQRQIFAKDLPRFRADRTLYMQTYFPHGHDPVTPPGLPDWQVVQGMTASEFDNFVTYVLQAHRDPFASVADFPNPAIARQLLRAYELEQLMSQQARDATQSHGKNTLDQYPISDATFIPPPPDAPEQLDKVRFVFHFHNASGFDAYKPIFHVHVARPDDPLPLLDRDFELKDRADPFDPGADQLIELSCCGITEDPVNNHLFKTLPVNTQFAITVTDVKDHNGQSVLDTHGFDQTAMARTHTVERCIRILRAHLATWSPPAPGEPECGPDTLDPNSDAAHAALANTSEPTAVQNAPAVQ